MVRVFIAAQAPIFRRSIALVAREAPDIQVVGESGDGWEALDSVYRLQPDVALMDVDMPGLSGIEATRRIKENCGATSVLVLSDYDTEDLMARSLEAGAKGYILKRAEIADLLAAVRTVYSGSVFICPQMTTKLVAHYLSMLQSTGSPDTYETLSEREQQVFALLAEGHTEQGIAATLYVSPSTVQTYRKRIMRKLGMHTKIELMKYALRRGVVRLAP